MVSYQVMMIIQSLHLYFIFKLVGSLFTSTSTQKGQFVPTAGEGNRLSWLRMTNEIQYILSYVTRKQGNVFTVKHLHKRNNRLCNGLK